VADEPGNDPAWRLIQLVRSGRSFSGRERNCVFLNTHQPRFADVSAVSGIDFDDDARAVGRVDWDHDGDLDLWISNRNAPQCRFLRNDHPAIGNWIALQLAGRVSNRDAIGARVTVSLDRQPPIVRTLRAGDGYMTQSSKWLHIGLGNVLESCSVEVRWPSGAKSTFSDLPVNRRYRLVENASEPEIVETARRLLLKPTPLRLPATSDVLQVSSAVRPFLPRLEYHDDQQSARDVVDLKGTPTLLVLWATWCQPCLHELSELARHEQELKAAGLVVLALCVDRLSSQADSDPNGAEELLRKLQFPHAWGMATEPLIEKLQLANDFLFGLQKPLPIPTSVLIDQDFRLAAIYRGPLDMARLRQDVANLSVKDRDRRPLSIPFAGRWAEEPTTLAMGEFVLELIHAGFVQDASELVQRTQGIYDRAAILDLIVRLGMAHFKNGSPQRAELHFQMARKIEPTTVGPEVTLAGWYEDQRQYEQAARHYVTALQTNPRSLPALNNLAWLRATCPADVVRNGEQAVTLATQAVKLAGRQPGLLDTLAAALAEAQRFDEAQQVAAQAADLARRTSQFNLAGEIERRRELFERRQAYRSEKAADKP
jgi:tetratricopeptide (TPR) repeat protein